MFTTSHCDIKMTKIDLSKGARVEVDQANPLDLIDYLSRPLQLWDQRVCDAFHECSAWCL